VYERYYGLRELPFELTPNPRYLYLTERHREALSNLQYGIVGRRGVTLLIGEAGTGKTTLVRSVLESERQRQTCCVYLNNPALTRSEFDLLTALASRPARVFSRYELVTRVQGYDYEGYERAIDVHVKNLRRKLGEDPHRPRIILTVTGVGYKFGAKPDA